MFNQLRNNIFVKFLWGFMGVYLLNISVDTPDPFPENIPENLAFNDQESIVELVIEKLLGFEDAFAEYDDPDSEDPVNKKNNIKINFLIQCSNEPLDSEIVFILSKQQFSSYDDFLIQGFQKLETPPPKV
ncbi:hypothetical protein [Mariniflexile sp.]|uniref:hypothetical protein n=1 Tax=Mariniflexile sp. TaxID=1979402 RepID=UPI00356A13DC